MGLFSMPLSAPSPPTKDPKSLPSPSDPSTKRPGTSGTELNLRAEKDKASTVYQRAQRAEAAYRAKRQAHNARQDIAAAKTHCREGFKQMMLCVGCVFRVVRGVPGVVREKQEARRQKGEVRSRERATEEKKRLEERLKKAEEGSEWDVGNEEAVMTVAA